MADEDGKSNGAQWAAAWIEQQRELLHQQAAEGAGTSEEARNLGARWLEVGRAYLGGLQEFAQHPAGGASFGSFKVGEELLDVWRNAWMSVDASQQSASRALSDMLGRLPPIGIAREHTEAWRELAATQAECQQLERELRGVLLGVQGDALNLLEERVRERQAGDQPITGYRDLYDLWVECAEQVFAKVAHSDAYGKLQAELGNASMRLRSHHQRVVEYGLRQLDLPTRSEMNTVHLQIRALKQQVAALGQRAAPPAAKNVRPAAKNAQPSAKKKSRRPQSRKRTIRGRSR